MAVEEVARALVGDIPVYITEPGASPVDRVRTCIMVSEEPAQEQMFPNALALYHLTVSSRATTRVEAQTAHMAAWTVLENWKPKDNIISCFLIEPASNMMVSAGGGELFQVSSVWEVAQQYDTTPTPESVFSVLLSETGEVVMHNGKVILG